MKTRDWLGVAMFVLVGAVPLLAQETAEPAESTVGGKTWVWQGSPPSEYWLGVAVNRPSAALLAQLGLPKDQGLVVDVIQANSPAAKAGIQTFDLLLKANGRLLEEPRDLVAEIAKVKEGKLVIELVRGGKRQSITVVAAKRPAEAQAELFAPDNAESESLRRWLQQMAPGWAEGRPLQFRYFHPGQILPPGAVLPGKTAEEMKFTIQRKLPNGYQLEAVGDGRNPVRITVTREKQQWQATEGDLSPLPEEVRPMVQAVLDKVQGYRILSEEPFYVPVPHGSSEAAPPAALESRLQKEIDDLNLKVEQLRKSLDELRSKKEVVPTIPPEVPYTPPPKPQPAPPAKE